MNRIDHIFDVLTSGNINLENADLIRDFEQEFDLIGLANGPKFEDLQIFQGSGIFANDTIIKDQLTGDFLAILQGVNAEEILEGDFTSKIETIIDCNPPAPAPTDTPLPTPRAVSFYRPN